jgi:hypothetical protein
VMREARASHRQVIAVTELALSCHAGRSVERRIDPEPRP